MRLTALLPTLAACLFFAAPALADTDPGQPETAPALDRSAADALTAIAGELRAEVHRQRPAAQSDHPLTVDEAFRQIPAPRQPGDVFNWVRDHIDFEPYEATLRGPQGTLIAGSGNAIDQALLARALLSRAGFDSRFVTGRLHRADAETVLRNTLGSASLFLDGDRVATDTAADPRRDSLVASLQDHIWLEVRQGDEHRPFDVVAAPLFGITPATPSERHTSIPRSMQSTLRVQLVSHLTDDQSENNITLEGPLHQFAYRTISLSFEDDLARRGGHRPVVTIDDERSAGISLPVADLQHLELRFQMRIGTSEHRWRQTLFREDQGTHIFDMDHQHFSIAVIPGWTSPHHTSGLTADATEEALSAVDAWISAAQQGPTGVREQENAVMNRLGASLPFAFAQNLDRATVALASRHGVFPVMTRPRVVTTGILRRGDQLHVDFQVAGDRLETYPREGIPTLAAQAFMGLYGQTRHELVGEMIRQYYGRQGSATVGRVFREASRARVPFTTIHGGAMDRLESLTLGSIAREAIARSIRQQSRIVLAPTRHVEIEGIDRAGWWALDTASGLIDGGTADPLLTIVADTEDRTLPVDTLIRTPLHLMVQHYSAAAQAADVTDRFAGVTCSAARQFLNLGRAYCATSSPIALPSLSSCLDDPPSPGAGLLNMQRVSCEDQLAPTRCAALMATAFLDGRLAVADSSASSPPMLSGLCS